ncbi:Protein CBR-HLH-3 [Caenorhabditis briggsae]|uniref:BHLH domain-containing protein n=2 Tax=Caenorhabditis briggsae TaxID=6238 RepID=A0AAE9IUD5_CAEBR|nr:Protein CBR-HLH-3 [Caenorhabditis briggsae]ULU05540.1 hypothetical protein L3Y34_017888 [Caenorhabditis briggsae]UMM17498.1 hypothetical protein L5515_014013 [Caenorhabditis briggsae]CAP23417.1 Protein CBR-HLH-3 [Caenorhabditis briggsae]
MPASTASTSSSKTSTSTKVRSPNKPISKQTKNKRNARERKRVDQVNQGFQRLQESVPRPANNKSKLSKVETLRQAAQYIRQLQGQLGIMPTGTPVDFPTPEHSPIFPSVMYPMMAQTPSPTYLSPYYPQPTPITFEMNPYYLAESCSSVSPAASGSGDNSFYSHADIN